ncbi:tetratricopeptide repeat protein [Rubinisphaera italica]|uniref:tetratricopeptide repeat protein n=1 Tax=Rubinisphaera italica TaxID=2527969 RepID=UPI0013EF4DD3|nr:tetratricopeptide repeat protein [Rubinisphaera italica]
MAGLSIATLPQSIGAIVFVSLDHFLVTLIAVCPLALFSLNALPKNFRHWFNWLFTVLALIASLCMMNKVTVSSENGLNQASLLFVQMLIACILAGSLGRNLPSLIKRLQWQSTDNENTAIKLKTRLGIFLLAATVIPFIHSQFLVTYHQTQFQEAMNHQRIEKARVYARDWSRLAPQAKWNSLKVITFYKDLQKQCDALKQQLSRFGSEVRPDQIGARIQMHLHLDQHENAIELIQPLLNSSQAALAWDTYGLILQREGEWGESLDAYSIALKLWQNKAGNSQASAGQTSAYRGIALAEKQIGKTEKAEAAYQKLIALAPTAENHFLLARFYEEKQRSELAMKHATRAAALAPDQFTEPAQKLIDMMKTSHFGCFRIYRSSQPGTSLQ